MTDRKIEDFGYCGAACFECNIFRTMHYGEELRQETIDRWRSDARIYWNVGNLEPKDLNCRGCRDESDDLFWGFKLCPVRDCARQNGLASCGYCPEFPECAWLEPPGRDNLILFLRGENDAQIR